MPERRKEPRADHVERRSFPRPPLWLNLALLILAGATFAYAAYQRNTIRQQTAALLRPSASSPAELNRIRDELSRMELTEAQIARELDGRMQLLQSIQSEQFYIAVDTTKRKFYFRLGGEVAREADIRIGEAKTITAGEKTWTFVPVKGSFTVTGKDANYPWRVPEWLYAMRNEPIPAERPVIQSGLGRFVIYLEDNYVIHSPPPATSPLHDMPKPGSIMVPEADLAAIWPRITRETRVYIF